METTYRRFTGLNIVSLLLVLPAFYVIAISILKYGLGFDAPFDASQPWLESMGIKDPPGWNITLVILFGPLIAALLAVLEVLSVEWQFNEEHFKLYISIRKRWFPIVIAIVSGLVLAVMGFYLFVENYDHL